jgi:hypothetical protein
LGAAVEIFVANFVFRENQKMSKTRGICATLAALCAASVFVSAANAAGINSYGDVTSDSSGYTLTSDPAGTGYAGIYYDYSASPIALNSITNLSADFTMTQGTFGGGAPRFSIIDTTNNAFNEAYVYFGTPGTGGTFTDPNNGSPESTGNFAANSDLRVQINGFNGDSTGASYITWSDFLSRDGSALVAYITLDLDGGFTGKQQMLVTSFDVTPAAAGATPLPAALPLFGSVLGFAGGYVGWRRRKKAA